MGYCFVFLLVICLSILRRNDNWKIRKLAIFGLIVILSVSSVVIYHLIEPASFFYVDDNTKVIALEKYSIIDDQKNNISQIDLTPKTNSDLNILKSMDIKQFIFNVSNNYTILPTLGGICVVVFTFYLLRRTDIVYVNNLEKRLFKKKHRWLGNNDWEEILVSIVSSDIHSKQEVDVLEYLNKELKKRKSHAYIVLGGPGEGKTVTLLQITLLLIKKYKRSLFSFSNFFNKSKNPKNIEYVERKNRLIPIYLTFHDIKNANTIEELEIIIKEQLKMLGKKNILSLVFDKVQDNFNKFFKVRLANGSFVFLFDGFDEISEEQRYSTANVLNNFCTNYPNCNIIVTSRTIVYQENDFLHLPHERILKLLPLSNEKIFEFVSKWSFPSLVDRTLLFNQLIGNFQLGRLAQNPFLLTMICNTYSRRESFDTYSVSQLYTEAIYCLLDTWEKEKRIPRRFSNDIPGKIQALSQLAYSEFIENENHLSLLPTTTVYNIDDYDLIAEQSQLIQKTGNKFFFSHRSIMEYFIAVYFGAQKINIELLDYDISKNRDIIVFYHAIHSSVKQTEVYLKQHVEAITVLEQIFLEKDITDLDIITQYFDKKMEALDSYVAQDYQQLGHFAVKYPVVAEKLNEVVLQRLYSSTDLAFINSALVCLMWFQPKKELDCLVKEYINNIDIESLSRWMSNSANDLFVNLFLLTTEASKKIDLVEILARNRKLDTLLQLFNHIRDENSRGIISYGLLYNSQDEYFWKWICHQKLDKHISETEKNEIKRYIEQYKWVGNSIVSAEQNVIYHLVYFFVTILPKYGDYLKLREMSNTIKFLSTYICNKENKTSVNYLIDIPDFQFSSVSELKFHWNKKNTFRGLTKNQKFLNILELTSFTSWLIFAVCMYLVAASNVSQAYTGVHALISKIYSHMPEGLYFTHSGLIAELFGEISYNLTFSQYFMWTGDFLIITMLWIAIYILINQIYLVGKLNFSSVMLYFTVNIFFLETSFVVINNFYYRIGIAIVLTITFCLNLLRHKNNHPSYKEPQYTQIRQFLSSDYLN